ncbi:SDR family NAD(P)-dependent oxidoreductase [Kineosporia sp. J2-2]|uniref:SDR family NAD(P)-dependent oxidoreductase n=1 Tax=Kineosporia corallincola TaxID=2835133 RepID=A0ABS5TBN4_9ACTN|nr:SDR family NAD(P)-dependent oxidoreductase [Kineosporia corallincola]MBT0768482.1 SDR family NAD(P)-dependent oxidoreductase [Kineosporia corallincola]
MSTTSTRPLALVSGGSAGIGLELARQLAGHGHDLALSGQSARVHETAARLEAEMRTETDPEGTGMRAYPHRGDAGTHEGVESFWDFVTALRRPVRVAVLNVGISLGGAFTDRSLEEHLRLVAVNVTGTVHLAKRVVDHMTGNGAGRILIVSSVSATTPTPYETVYGPTKAFGFSFAESLREELKDTGVSVTALLPGATATQFHARAGMDNRRFGDNSWKNDPAAVARQGYQALMAGADHVVGGDEATRREAELNRTTPEPVKAARFAASARPD